MCGVDGGGVAAQFCFIDNVVVYKRGVVKDFDYQRSPVGVDVCLAENLCRQIYEHWAYAFAFCSEYFVNQVFEIAAVCTDCVGKQFFVAVEVDSDTLCYFLKLGQHIYLLSFV